jgi:hypothetical protein
MEHTEYVMIMLSKVEGQTVLIHADKHADAFPFLSPIFSSYDDLDLQNNDQPYPLFPALLSFTTSWPACQNICLNPGAVLATQMLLWVQTAMLATRLLLRVRMAM